METRAAELLRYVRFVDEDARCLRAFREVARPSFARVAQEFYERTREHEDAHAIFTGEEQIARLRRSLVTWLERLLSGSYDDAYFAQTAQIGKVHVKVGLPPRYMPVAMAFVRDALGALADAVDPEHAAQARRALAKTLDVELTIMLEAYRDDVLARLARTAASDREVLSRRVAQTEHRYVNAVELAHGLVIGLDRDGCVRLFNRMPRW